MPHLAAHAKFSFKKKDWLCIKVGKFYPTKKLCVENNILAAKQLWQNPKWWLQVKLQGFYFCFQRACDTSGILSTKEKQAWNNAVWLILSCFWWVRFVFFSVGDAFKSIKPRGLMVTGLCFCIKDSLEGYVKLNFFVSCGYRPWLVREKSQAQPKCGQTKSIYTSVHGFVSETSITYVKTSIPRLPRWR